MKPQTRAITINRNIGTADPLEVRSGPSIAPIARLKLFSATEWEEFVSEWASTLNYHLVERIGGAGDKGCDVIATVDPSPESEWDNYQCKHYDHPLAPSDIWIEIAKLCYFTFKAEYDLPRRYYFVGPRGVGTKLSRLLKRPDQLKRGLLENWDAKCSQSLIESKTVSMDVDLRAHIEQMDFSIFGQVPPQMVIDGHSKTRYFIVRFGLGLPARPPSPTPPADVSPAETIYVRKLLAAYSDNRGRELKTPTDLDAQLARHFSRARQSFYCAEALRNFSRDTLPDGAFEHLQGQVFDGVIDVCDAQHSCGLTRVNATTAQAALLALTSSALLGRTDIADRHGICHQLANDDRLDWVAKP